MKILDIPMLIPKRQPGIRMELLELDVGQQAQEFKLDKIRSIRTAAYRLKVDMNRCYTVKLLRDDQFILIERLPDAKPKTRKTAKTKHAI